MANDKKITECLDKVDNYIEELEGQAAKLQLDLDESNQKYLDLEDEHAFLAVEIDNLRARLKACDPNDTSHFLPSLMLKLKNTEDENTILKEELEIAQAKLDFYLNQTEAST